jgi:hypothetical protein
VNHLQPGESRDRRAGGILWRCVVLVVVVWGAFGLVAWFVQARDGGVYVQAAAVAAGVCWLSGTLALMSAGWFRDPRQVMLHLLLGMVFRMGLPFGTGVWLQSRGGPLAEAGVFGYIVGFYLLMLLAETVLAVSYFKAANRPAGVL